jgi:hypothetical protein
MLSLSSNTPHNTYASKVSFLFKEQIPRLLEDAQIQLEDYYIRKLGTNSSNSCIKLQSRE